MNTTLQTWKNQFLALEIPENSVSLKKYPSYGQSADRYGLQVTIPYGQYTMYLQQGACGILSEIAPGSLVGSLTTHSLKLTLYLQVLVFMEPATIKNRRSRIRPEIHHPFFRPFTGPQNICRPLHPSSSAHSNHPAQRFPNPLRVCCHV